MLKRSIYWSRIPTLTIFLKSWLEGEDTGSLETVAYSFMKNYEIPYVKKIVNQKVIKKLAKSCVEQKDTVILGREVGGHLTEDTDMTG